MRLVVGSYAVAHKAGEEATLIITNIHVGEDGEGAGMENWVFINSKRGGERMKWLNGNTQRCLKSIYSEVSECNNTSFKSF